MSPALQPHPDACPQCQRPCYAVSWSTDIGAPRADGFVAQYRCSCRHRWRCWWAFSTMIDNPDPTPVDDTYTPPLEAMA